MSRPSTLPTKLIGDSSSRLKTSRTSSLPFPSSSPTDSRPTRGLAHAQDVPGVDVAHDGVLGEMPGLRIDVGADVEQDRPAALVRQHRRDGRAGRRPAARPSTNIAMAIAAPVLPAEMKADASPSRTSYGGHPQRRVALAAEGLGRLSPISTTWEAWRTVIGSVPHPMAGELALDGRLVPDQDDARPNSRAAATAPSTMTARPPSPPIASTAIFMRPITRRRRGHLARRFRRLRWRRPRAPCSTRSGGRRGAGPWARGTGGRPSAWGRRACSACGACDRACVECRRLGRGIGPISYCEAPERLERRQPRIGLAASRTGTR